MCEKLGQLWNGQFTVVLGYIEAETHSVLEPNYNPGACGLYRPCGLNKREAYRGSGWVSRMGKPQTLTAMSVTSGMCNG